MPEAPGFGAAIVLALFLSGCGSNRCEHLSCGSRCCPDPSCNVYNTDDPRCSNCSNGYCNKDGDCIALTPDAGAPVCK